MGLDIYFTKKKIITLGYFRKVNFLVKYFSDLGFDVVNQVPFEIEEKEVLDLLNRCNQVLDDNSLAPKLLPTMSGFFFGSTLYDEIYFTDVQNVKDYIEKILLPEFGTLENDEQITFETSY